MKIILSRKGFDSTAGGMASPILPDGTLLSLPIPDKLSQVTYDDIRYEGVKYSEILQQLRGEEKQNHWKCHIDPDIRPILEITEKCIWKPSFGQEKMSLSYLENREVGEGDIFLFFGWFKQTEGDFRNGTLKFVKGAPDIHIIYGYLQVDEIVKDKNEMKKKFPLHPHSVEERLIEQSNAIFVAKEFLTIDKKKKGYGVLNFSEDRILTKEGCPRSFWKIEEALMPSNTLKDSNKALKDGYLNYLGQWQEMILKDNKVSEEWAKKILDINN